MGRNSMPGKKRLTMEFPPRTYQKLHEIAEARSTLTMAEVIRKALDLYWEVTPGCGCTPEEELILRHRETEAEKRIIIL